MVHNDVITLVKKTYETDAIGQQIASETRREIFCNVTYVSGSEFFQAGQNGIQAEFRATIFRYEYEGEDICEYKGKRYYIYRTYAGNNDYLDIYLERRSGI